MQQQSQCKSRAALQRFVLAILLSLYNTRHYPVIVPKYISDITCHVHSKFFGSVNTSPRVRDRTQLLAVSSNAVQSLRLDQKSFILLSLLISAVLYAVLHLEDDEN